jgi:hypothetical protein
MVKKCVFVVLVFFHLSCSQHNTENLFFEEISDTKPALYKGIVSELSGYINFSKNENKNYGGKDTIICYVVEFDEYKGDSVVIFSENISGLIDYTGYRGVFKLDTNDIIIIDKKNIGNNFYNIDSLQSIDTNILQKINKKARGIAEVKISRGSIISKYDWKNHVEY